jgi:hypothetical protein
MNKPLTNMIKPKHLVKKSLLTSFITMALLLVIGSCDNEENASPSKGKMTLSFSPSQGPSGGRAKENEKPQTVIVSVVNEDGESMDYVRLNLLAFGEGYVSENLELATGHYRLTDFFVASENELIYATPKEGAPLSEFVNDPLDIEFDILKDGNTLVKPEVIAIEDAAQPGDFGYASFGFDVVKVTALLLPETTETIVKVSYVFNDQYMFDTHKGEVVPANSVANLDNPKLLNRIWRGTVMVWTEPKDCSTQWSYSPYQKVYRLSTEMLFEGAAFQLPSFSDARWEPLYFRTSRGIGYLFSTDPLNNYSVEVIVPDDIIADYCWLDRRFWNAQGGETCNLGEDAYAHLSMDGEPVGKFLMKDQPVCETANLKVVDSYVAVNSNKGAFHEFFSWTMVDGKLVPTCDQSQSSSHSFTGLTRTPPTLK